MPIDSPARQTSPPVLVKNDAKSDSATLKTDVSSVKTDAAKTDVTKIDAAKIDSPKIDASVKNDASIKKDSVMATNVKPDLPSNPPSNLPSKKDSVLKEVARTDSPATTPTTAASSPVSFPAILKISEKKTDREVVLAYTDKGPDGKMDTIRISIPVDPEGSIVPKKDSVKRWQANPRPLRDTLVAKADSVRKSTSPSTSPQVKNDTVVTLAKSRAEADSIQKLVLAHVKTDSLLKAGKSLPKTESVNKPSTSVWNTDSSRKANTSAVKKDSAGKANPVNGQPVTRAPVMINSDCVNFATEYDLDKLRVRMVDEVTAEDRISAAKKIFRTKCFTTRQIRALTELFLNDEGKYKFLDAAYPFVSDSQDFRKLADLLKEDYYVKRFYAMIRS